MRYFEDIYSATPRPFGDGPSEAAKALAGHLARTKHGTKPTVIDLGCGYGRDCIHLAKNGCAVTGIDTSRRGILTAQLWAKQEGLDVRFMTKDILETGLPDKSFDGILCVGVLEYIDVRRRPKVGHEIYRLAAPGGTLGLLALATDDPELGTGKDLGENTWEVKLGLPVHFFTEREIRQFFPDFERLRLEVITVHEDIQGPKDRRYWLLLGQRP
jgi:SAM-dependent methyltransferase